MDSYVDASEIDLLYSTKDETPFDYPSPSASSNAEHLQDDNEPPKKKRKAWGQPVPEIVPILPPRKRAKTAEEKEQRKNERILRNRRAADKSRQRQKAAQADLEQQNKDLVAENAQLKALLSQHGLLSDFKFMTPPPSVDLSVPSPTEQTNDTPMFSADTPAPSIQYQESPTLAPTLDLNKVTNSSISIQPTGMTQYPAVSTGLGHEASISSTEFYGQYGLDSNPLPDNCEELFDFNALSNVSGLPDFGTGIGSDLHTAGIDCPEQFRADPYFDFNAFDFDSTGSFPFETPQPTSGLQSQFSASFDDGRRPGFAAET